MTRAERLAEKEARTRDKLAAQRKRLAPVQAQQREEERKALTKRCMAVGMCAEQAGLFAFDDATLAGLFRLLTTLHAEADPVARLTSLAQIRRGGQQQQNIKRDAGITRES
jgi:ferredoxin